MLKIFNWFLNFIFFNYFRFGLSNCLILNETKAKFEIFWYPKISYDAKSKTFAYKYWMEINGRLVKTYKHVTRGLPQFELFDVEEIRIQQFNENLFKLTIKKSSEQKFETYWIQYKNEGYWIQSYRPDAIMTKDQANEISDKLFETIHLSNVTRYFNSHGVGILGWDENLKLSKTSRIKGCQVFYWAHPNKFEFVMLEPELIQSYRGSGTFVYSRLFNVYFQKKFEYSADEDIYVSKAFLNFEEAEQF
jgi:hypothetical protein